MKRLLVACEMSGIVREAFRRKGWDAWSCDIVPTTQPGQHIVNDVLNVLDWDWDMMIAFPPCTHLAVSGARWFPEKVYEQRQALDFVRLLWDAPIERIAIENPVGVISTHIRKPHAIIQPWQFGHGETKATCLWVKNLPVLKPTDVVDGREQRIWKMPPSGDRAMLRSLTYEGVAEAMAAQWGTDEGLSSDMPLFAGAG